MWLIQIFDLHPESLQQVEDAIRAMDGVGLASAVRDGQPYVVPLNYAYADGKTLSYKLAYQPFFITGAMVADGNGGTVLAGGYYDIHNQPILDHSDAARRHFFSDCPDGTSLLKLDAPSVAGVKGNATGVGNTNVTIGDSIAINGACMTVTSLDADRFTIDVSAESLDKTAGLGEPGPVNLEKALRAHDRLGGHIVSGHVDGVGTVTRMAPVGESWELRILAPAALGKYLAYKGSITVNGVSLTVNRIEDRADGTALSINLIPHTVESTALHALQAGSRVNLEIDLIARYVERMLAPSAAKVTA